MSMGTQRLKHGFVKELVGTLVHRVRERTSVLSKVSGHDEMRRRLRRFDAGVEGNFVMWMGQGLVSVRSPPGKYVIEENVVVETRENHAEMLRTFCAQVDALPNAEDFAAVQFGVSAIREVLKAMNGIDVLTMMLVFEHASLEFMPHLERYARVLGARDFTYINVHSEADVEHSSMFVWALDNELEFQYPDAKSRIEAASAKALGFIDALLT